MPRGKRGRQYEMRNQQALLVIINYLKEKYRQMGVAQPHDMNIENQYKK